MGWWAFGVVEIYMRMTLSEHHLREISRILLSANYSNMYICVWSK